MRSFLLPIIVQNSDSNLKPVKTLHTSKSYKYGYPITSGLLLLYTLHNYSHNTGLYYSICKLVKYAEH